MKIPCRPGSEKRLPRRKSGSAARLRSVRLTRCGRRRKHRRGRLNHRRHIQKPASGHIQCFRGSQRQIEHTSFRERAAVIHDHDDAALRSWISHAKACAEREATVRRGEFRRIIFVATGGAARIVGAVVRSDTGELMGELGESNVRCGPS
jgi:hypothetical protein